MVKHYAFLSYGPWGNNPAHIRTRQLGAEMLRRGIRVTYVVDDYLENHTDQLVPAGAEVAFVPSPRGPRQLPARRRIIQELKADFVHVKDLVFRTPAALAMLPSVRMVLDWDEPNVFKPLDWHRHQHERLLASWANRHANKVIVTTRRLQTHVKEHYNVEGGYLPYATYLKPAADGPSPFDKPTAVYMGSMHALWDIDLMMDAITQLAGEGFKAPIAFVGTSPHSQWGDFARAKGLDHLQFLGHQPDEMMWRYIRHAHVLLFPIRPTLINETRCPSKTFVYAQARRPVITSRVGEVAAVLGEGGLYVDATPAAMAAELRRVMEAPRPADIDYRVEERYNYRDRVDQLLAFLAT